MHEPLPSVGGPQLQVVEKQRQVLFGGERPSTCFRPLHADFLSTLGGEISLTFTLIFVSCPLLLRTSTASSGW